MNRMLLVCTLFLTSATILAAAESEEREWSFKIGTETKTVTARLEAISKGQAKLRDAAGKTYDVPLGDLPKEQCKEALIQRVGSGVVMVHANTVFDTPAGVGSGFVIMKDGYILTNYHVIRGAGSIEVAFRDQSEKMKAECWGVDRSADIAVLKVEQLPAGTHVIELSVTAIPKQGDSVWTIGHPQGLKNTVSWGDVNAVRKTTDLPDRIKTQLSAADDTLWIQTDAVISQGSSGGPLLNMQGQALGMNTFLVGAQLGFAVHLQQARGPFQKARETKKALPLPIPPEKDELAMAWASREVAPVLKSYSEAMKALQAGMVGGSREKAQAAVQQLNAKYRAEFMQVVNKDPSGWPAFQAMFYVCNIANDGSKEGEATACKICDLVIKHHVDKKDLGSLVNHVAPLQNDEVRKFIRSLAEKSPHQQVQAQATFSLALGRLQWLVAEGGMDLKATTEARQEIEQLAKKMETDFSKLPFGGEAPGAEMAKVIRTSLAAVPMGEPAQEISGVDVEGKTFKLSDYKGKVIVLDFFADWCPWCRKMYRTNQKMEEMFKDKPFALLGVHCENQAILTKLAEKKTVTWRSWADGEQGPIATAWDVSGFPCVYLLDQQGVVRRKFNGTPTEEDLIKEIGQLLKEVPAAK